MPFVWDGISYKVWPCNINDTTNELMQINFCLSSSSSSSSMSSFSSSSSSLSSSSSSSSVSSSSSLSSSSSSSISSSSSLSSSSSSSSESSSSSTSSSSSSQSAGAMLLFFMGQDPDDPGDQGVGFVWDVAKGTYADIPDAQGGNPTFLNFTPGGVTKSEMQHWLDATQPSGSNYDQGGGWGGIDLTGSETIGNVRRDPARTMIPSTYRDSGPGYAGCCCQYQSDPGTGFYTTSLDEITPQGTGPNYNDPACGGGFATYPSNCSTCGGRRIRWWDVGGDYCHYEDTEQIYSMAFFGVAFSDFRISGIKVHTWQTKSWSRSAGGGVSITYANNNTELDIEFVVNTPLGSVSRLSESTNPNRTQPQYFEPSNSLTGIHSYETTGGTKVTNSTGITPPLTIPPNTFLVDEGNFWVNTTGWEPGAGLGYEAAGHGKLGKNAFQFYVVFASKHVAFGGANTGQFNFNIEAPNGNDGNNTIWNYNDWLGGSNSPIYTGDLSPFGSNMPGPTSGGQYPLYDTPDKVCMAAATEFPSAADFYVAEDQATAPYGRTTALESAIKNLIDFYIDNPNPAREPLLDPGTGGIIRSINGIKYRCPVPTKLWAHFRGQIAPVSYSSSSVSSSSTSSSSESFSSSSVSSSSSSSSLSSSSSSSISLQSVFRSSSSSSRSSSSSQSSSSSSSSSSLSSSSSSESSSSKSSSSSSSSSCLFGINDNFTGTNGDLPNVHRWNLVDSNNVISIQNNELEFDATALNSTVNSYVDGNFVLQGEFDIVLVFNINELNDPDPNKMYCPRFSVVRVSDDVVLGSVARVRGRFGTDFNYNGFAKDGIDVSESVVQPVGVPVVRPLPISASGGLRIIRDAGDEIYVFYQDGSGTGNIGGWEWGGDTNGGIVASNNAEDCYVRIEWIQHIGFQNSGSVDYFATSAAEGYICPASSSSSSSSESFSSSSSSESSTSSSSSSVSSSSESSSSSSLSSSSSSSLSSSSSSSSSSVSSSSSSSSSESSSSESSSSSSESSSSSSKSSSSCSETWVSIHNNSRWTPYSGFGFNPGTWDAGNSEWDSQIDSGQRWIILEAIPSAGWWVGIKDNTTRMRVTHNAAGGIDLINLYEDNQTGIADFFQQESAVGSGVGNDFVINWSTNDLKYILFRDTGNFSITDIEFLTCISLSSSSSSSSSSESSSSSSSESQSSSSASDCPIEDDFTGSDFDTPHIKWSRSNVNGYAPFIFNNQLSLSGSDDAYLISRYDFGGNDWDVRLDFDVTNNSGAILSGASGDEWELGIEVTSQNDTTDKYRMTIANKGIGLRYSAVRTVNGTEFNSGTAATSDLTGTLRIIRTGNNPITGYYWNGSGWSNLGTFFFGSGWGQTKIEILSRTDVPNNPVVRQFVDNLTVSGSSLTVNCFGSSSSSSSSESSSSESSSSSSSSSGSISSSSSSTSSSSESAGGGEGFLITENPTVRVTEDGELRALDEFIPFFARETDNDETRLTEEGVVRVTNDIYPSGVRFTDDFQTRLTEDGDIREEE